MPRCLNFKDPKIDSSEKSCLKDCVKGLHRSNDRMFNYLIALEDNMKKDGDTLISQLETEIKEEKKQQIKETKKKAIEIEGLVRV